MSGTTPYTVTASLSGCTSAASTSFSNDAIKPILTPTITCGGSTASSVIFNWLAVTGATGYTVSYQVNSTTPVNIGTIGNVLTYTVSSLTASDNVTITVTPTGAPGACFGLANQTCQATNCTPPTATISYAGSPFCTSILTAQAVTLTGTNGTDDASAVWNYTGGTYSSTGALSISSTTGEITPTTAGNFTVSYVIPASGSCAAVTVTTPIVVTPLPTAAISYTGPFCITNSTPQAGTLTGTNAYTGGTYTSTSTLAVNASTGEFTPSANSAGNYTVTYTKLASGGCPAVIATTPVTIDPVLTPTITCGASTASSVIFNWLAVTGATGYTVSYQVNSTTPVNIGTIGNVLTYTVSSLTASDNVTITVTPTGAPGACFGLANQTCQATNCTPPTATISYAGSPFCTSILTAQAVTLTGTNGTDDASAVWNYTGGTYSSTGALSISSTTGEITPTTAGNFTVSYVIPASGSCAAVTVTTPIVVTPLPTAAISYTGPFCITNSTPQAGTLTGTNAYTGGTYTSTSTLAVNASTGEFTPSANSAGNYTVTYTKLASGGCPAVIATTPVTITALPTANLSYTGSPFCSSLTTPQSVTLTGTNAYIGGTYSSNPGSLSIDPNTGDITPSTSSVLNYTVQYTTPASGGCPSVNATTPVIINALPNASISGSTTICEGNTTPINFTGTPNAVVTYSIDGGSNLTVTLNGAGEASINTPTLSVSSTYDLVSVSNATSNCPQTVIGNALISVNPAPNLVITNPQNVCFPSTVNLTASAITLGSTGGGVLTYWTDLGATSSLNTPTAISTSGTYYIKSTSNGCFDVKPVTVTINTTPSLLISNPPVICEPATVNLTQAGITAGSLNVGINSYFSDNACTVPVATPTAVNSSGTYYIKSLAGNCFDIKPIIVTINPLPTVVIGTTASGCAPLKVDLTDPSLTAGSTPGISFNYWNDNLGTNPLATPTSVSNGTYYISGTLNGCKSAPSQVTVTIHPLPIADFNPTPDLISTLNPETHLKNNSLGADTYFWDFGDGKFSQEVSPYHIYPDKDTATFFPYLIATSQFGCVDTIIKKVKVYEELAYFIPNTFTPDEDDFNNTFQPVFVSGYDPYNFSMYIFNRWGELIFESHDAKIGWRGTYGSSLEIAKEGVYTWKINFNLKSDDRKKEITGHVNLIK